MGVFQKQNADEKHHLCFLLVLWLNPSASFWDFDLHRLSLVDLEIADLAMHSSSLPPSSLLLITVANIFLNHFLITNGKQAWVSNV